MAPVLDQSLEVEIPEEKAFNEDERDFKESNFSEIPNISYKRDISDKQETNLIKDFKAIYRDDVFGDIKYINDTGNLYPNPSRNSIPEIEPILHKENATQEIEEVYQNVDDNTEVYAESSKKRSKILYFGAAVAFLIILGALLLMVTPDLSSFNDKGANNALNYPDKLGTITYAVTEEGISVNYPSFFNLLMSLVERVPGL